MRIKPVTKSLLGLLVLGAMAAPGIWLLGEGAGKGAPLGTQLLLAGIGVIWGLGFAALAFPFVLLGRIALRPPLKAQLGPGEKVEYSLPANHLEGLAAHGGKLLFTTHRLIFVPHAFNWRRVPIVIPWADVRGTAIGSTPEFATLKVAVFALSLLRGRHQFLPDSQVLRIRHDQTEARFVVMPGKELTTGLAVRGLTPVPD